jgi:tetratricopeptide (TPR) repeat protein
VIRKLGLFACFSWLTCVGCAEGSGGITRMADGVRYEGRFVNPAAYAAYLLGVEREARGEYKNALSSYLEAHAEDPDSPEIWARIGAVQCAASTPERGPKAAQVAFERGLRNDPDYFGNYLERARCAERARAFNVALSDATAAVARRPDDESANLMVARVLQALGRSAEARAWLEGLQTYRTPSVAAARALEATRRPVGPTPAPAPNSTSASASVATSAPTSAPTSSAARSAAFAELQSGRAERARKQALLELDADPTNSDAWIAALVACDALRDAQCFESALTSLRTPSLAPSQEALGYLRELLDRRTGSKLVF